MLSMPCSRLEDVRISNVYNYQKYPTLCKDKLFLVIDLYKYVFSLNSRK